MLYFVFQPHWMQWFLKFGLLTISIISVSLLHAAPPVVGWLEGVHVDGIKNRLRAKLDSGALTSSIHGTHRRTFERDGERWLRFDFHWYKESKDQWFGPVIVEAPLVRRVLIKDHEDDSQKRPVVNLHFSLNGECHITQFSVVDRSGFNYPVLLGRRFLENHVIIDPSKIFTKATSPKNKSACRTIDDTEIEQTVVRIKRDKEKVEHYKEKQKESRKTTLDKKEKKNIPKSDKIDESKKDKKALESHHLGGQEPIPLRTLPQDNSSPQDKLGNKSP